MSPTHLTFRTSLDAPGEAVFAWHERPGAFERLTPPWMKVSVLRTDGIRDGDRAAFVVRRGPFSLRWEAVHRDYRPGEGFTDVQVRGPFTHWEHRHRFVPAGPRGCLLEDDLTYALPGGLPGDRLAGPHVRADLARMFAYRHRITRNDLAALGTGSRPFRIALTGSSGLLGSALSAFLRAGGHTVLPLVRTPPPSGTDAVYWNPATGDVDADRLEGLDAVVHLAGENVLAFRWTREKKRQIYESRVRGTEGLCRVLARLRRPPSVLLSASGIGIYGEHGSIPVTEATPAGDAPGFLARVCRDWEAATYPARSAGIRTHVLRIGVVLTPAGGALRQMLPAFRLGAGGPLGRRRQYLSWITLDDLIYAIFHIICTPTDTPAFNLTAPEPATTETFARTLGRVLRRPSSLRIPPPLLRLAMGEAAREILLTGALVLPERLAGSGFVFRFPSLEPALRHLLGRFPFPSGNAHRPPE